MKLTKQRLKEIIKEELESSNPPEWETADKILRNLAYLAQDLEDSSNAEPAKLAFAIVGKLREAVDAMERRLNEKFAAAKVDDEESDEEALHLSGPTSQREIDRLAYSARTGRWRK
jgi:hypothetical protein